jgi:hypothetical protein
VKVKIQKEKKEKAGLPRPSSISSVWQVAKNFREPQKKRNELREREEEERGGKKEKI